MLDIVPFEVQCLWVLLYLKKQFVGGFFEVVINSFNSFKSQNVKCYFISVLFLLSIRPSKGG